MILHAVAFAFLFRCTVTFRRRSLRRGFVHDTVSKSGGGSVAVENRSDAKMTVYCAGVDRKERSVPAGGRVFVEDLGVHASAGSPLFCGVVTSDSTASWNVTALGGRA